MQLTFFGTSSMVPTKERNPSSFFLSYKDEGILFDCGEGTQRQMAIAGIKPTKITKILLSHWHGDHVLGLAGLIQTMGAMEYAGKLEIYGPKGTLKHFKGLFDAYVFDLRINIDVKEVEAGVFFENNEFRLEALPLSHRTPCVAFAFVEKEKRKINMVEAKKLGLSEGPLIGQLQEGKSVVHEGKKITPDMISTVVKGRKLAFVTDTVLVKNCAEIAKDADLLVCEASYTSELQDKAAEYKHLTALEAGQIASRANVKKLVMTHFSARYKNTIELEKDARTAFDNVLAAKDFMKVNM